MLPPRDGDCNSTGRNFEFLIKNNGDWGREAREGEERVRISSELPPHHDYRHTRVKFRGDTHNAETTGVACGPGSPPSD